MYPDYYTHVFNRPTGPSRHNHIGKVLAKIFNLHAPVANQKQGHCINHIRQSLQCNADLTPMEWRLEGSRIILKTDTRHTCRNFDKIHAWATLQHTQFQNIQSFLNGSLVIVD